MSAFSPPLPTATAVEFFQNLTRTSFNKFLEHTLVLSNLDNFVKLRAAYPTQFVAMKVLKTDLRDSNEFAQRIYEGKMHKPIWRKGSPPTHDQLSRFQTFVSMKVLTVLHNLYKKKCKSSAKIQSFSTGPPAFLTGQLIITIFVDLFVYCRNFSSTSTLSVYTVWDMTKTLSLKIPERQFRSLVPLSFFFISRKWRLNDPASFQSKVPATINQS